MKTICKYRYITWNPRKTSITSGSTTILLAPNKLFKNIFCILLLCILKATKYKNYEKMYHRYVYVFFTFLFINKINKSFPLKHHLWHPLPLNLFCLLIPPYTISFVVTCIYFPLQSHPFFLYFQNSEIAHFLTPHNSFIQTKTDNIAQIWSSTLQKNDLLSFIIQSQVIFSTTLKPTTLSGGYKNHFQVVLHRAYGSSSHVPSINIYAFYTFSVPSSDSLLNRVCFPRHSSIWWLTTPTYRSIYIVFIITFSIKNQISLHQEFKTSI